jgi:hypothetical protein
MVLLGVDGEAVSVIQLDLFSLMSESLINPGEVLNLRNPSGRTRPWGLLSL